ncbi:MAG: tetratricopeptide repeat protein [Brevinema sp.]
MKIISKGFVTGNSAKAICFFYKGNYQQASKIWRGIYKVNPQDINAAKGLAFCSMMDESFGEALEYLEEIKPSATTDPEIYNFIALLHLKSGKVSQATEIILNALEILPKDPLLQKTLEHIRHTNDREHAKTISILPLIQLTMPITWGTLFYHKKIVATFAMMFLFLFMLRAIWNPVYRILDTIFRFEKVIVTPINDFEIKDMDQIINSRENYRIVLSEEVILRKFEELKKALNAKQPNRSRILANELLASNAGVAVKERVSILEAFIPEATPDNIDYIPTYAEIASAPALYKGVVLRWKGLTTNLHKTRKLLTFDLLINFIDGKKVEGIAAVEITTHNPRIHYFNGEDVTVTGHFDGMTPDNRVIIKALTFEVFRASGPPFSSATS